MERTEYDNGAAEEKCIDQCLYRTKCTTLEETHLELVDGGVRGNC
jgi:hypothetical protein